MKQSTNAQVSCDQHNCIFSINLSLLSHSPMTPFYQFESTLPRSYEFCLGQIALRCSATLRDTL